MQSTYQAKEMSTEAGIEISAAQVCAHGCRNITPACIGARKSTRAECGTEGKTEKWSTIRGDEVRSGPGRALHRSAGQVVVAQLPRRIARTPGTPSAAVAGAWRPAPRVAMTSRGTGAAARGLAVCRRAEQMARSRRSRWYRAVVGAPWCGSRRRPATRPSRLDGFGAQRTEGRLLRRLHFPPEYDAAAAAPPARSAAAACFLRRPHVARELGRLASPPAQLTSPRARAPERRRICASASRWRSSTRSSAAQLALRTARAPSRSLACPALRSSATRLPSVGFLNAATMHRHHPARGPRDRHHRALFRPSASRLFSSLACWNLASRLPHRSSRPFLGTLPRLGSARRILDLRATDHAPEAGRASLALFLLASAA